MGCWGEHPPEIRQHRLLSDRRGKRMSNSVWKLHLPDDVSWTRKSSQSKSSSSDPTDRGEMDGDPLLFLRELRGEGVWGTDAGSCSVLTALLLVPAFCTIFWHRLTARRVGTCTPSNAILFLSGTEFIRGTSIGVTSRVAGSDSNSRTARSVLREIRLRFRGPSSDRNESISFSSGSHRT